MLLIILLPRTLLEWKNRYTIHELPREKKAPRVNLSAGMAGLIAKSKLMSSFGLQSLLGLRAYASEQHYSGCAVSPEPLLFANAITAAF